MSTTVHIHVHDMPMDSALESLCHEEAEKLARFFGRIMSCHISISRPHHHRKDIQPCVRVGVAIPGSLLVVERPPRAHGDEPLETALHRAFEAMRRRLEDEARRQRGDIKTHATPPHGRISRLDSFRGRGSLTTPDGRELDFPAHGVREAHFEDLELGMEVAFHEEQGEYGLRASVVRPVGPRLP